MEEKDLRSVWDGVWDVVGQVPEGDAALELCSGTVEEVNVDDFKEEEKGDEGEEEGNPGFLG